MVNFVSIGYEQARTSLLLLLRDPRSVLDYSKHIKHRLHDDTTPSSHSSPNLRTGRACFTRGGRRGSLGQRAGEAWTGPDR